MIPVVSCGTWLDQQGARGAKTVLLMSANGPHAAASELAVSVFRYRRAAVVSLLGSTASKLT